MAIGRIPEPGTGIPESIVDAKGDIVTATAADTPARLAVGSNEQRLVADSAAATGLKYVADTTNYAIAAKGDLLVGTAADTLAALSVGTNGHTLVADSSTSTGLKWAAASGASYVGAGGYLSTSVSANNSTATKIILNNENFDTDSILDVATNQGRFTVPSGKGGKWLLNAAVLFQGAAGNTTVWVYAYKNGSSTRFNKAQAIGGQGEIVAQMNQVYDLVAGDYIEVYVMQNSGGTLSFYVPNNEAGIQFSYLGA